MKLSIGLLAGLFFTTASFAADIQPSIDAVTAYGEQTRVEQKAIDDALLAQTVAAKNAIIDQQNQAYIQLKAEYDAYKLAHPGDLPPPPDTNPPPPATDTWPYAKTTGYKGTLTAYSGPMTITTAGTVIDHKDIKGTITVKAANVKITNSKFSNFAWYGILSENNTVTVEDTVFDGRGSTGTKAMGVKGCNCLRNNIFGMVIAIDIWGGPATIQDNFIHDLAEASSNPDARHFDGIAFRGGSDVTIKHNTIEVSDGTACTFITSQAGSINNVLVQDNLLLGQASYPAYAENASGKTMTNVRYIDNYIERGIYGYILNSGNAVDQGNVKWQDGKDPVPAKVAAWRSAVAAN